MIYGPCFCVISSQWYSATVQNAAMTPMCRCRGLDKGHFRRLLQCWALMHMEPLHKMARDLQPAFDRPVSDVIRSQQVTHGSESPISSFA